MVNSIVWGNGPSQISAEDLIVSYSDVQGGYTGTANLDVHPLFTSALDSSLAPTSGGDYDLSSGDSLVVGAADGSTAPLDDIDGDLRPQGGSYDMGADEYVPSTVTVTRGSYNYLAHTLDVTATSPNGSSANLVLVGYGPMSWSSNKQHWAISASMPAPPASFTVCGPLDGCKVTE